MRRLSLICLTLLLLAAGTAWAQPILERPESPTAPTGVKIPIHLPDVTEVMGGEASGNTSPPAAVPVDQPVDPDSYACGPGDVFEIVFWGKQNFRLQIAANLEGNVFISKIGFVKVAGHTLTAVRAAVRKEVKRSYPGLAFELTLMRPRSFLVHLAENVKTPGAYTAHPLERVGSLIARAGGSTGSRRRIEVKRVTGKTEIADLVLYELTGDTKANPYVLDGDVIRVPTAELTVVIKGAVNRPGTYELVGTRDLAELLHLAGGLKTSASRTLPVQLVRRNAKQRPKYTNIELKNGQPTNYPLLDDDEINVRSVQELQQSILLVGAVAHADTVDEATASRRLQLIENDTVRSVLERAGGVSTTGDLKRAFITRPRKNEPALVIPIDLEALLVRRDFSVDQPVYLGDTLTVPPMRYGILVDGAIAHPGTYPFRPQFGIREYIAQAGGRTRTARDLDEIRVIDQDGKVRNYRDDLRLSSGDAIIVPERNFSRAEIAQLAIAGAGVILSAVAIAIAANR